MRGERTKPYKEDSTKGNSMINPLNYKGDVLVQVWIDSRVLATLCGWLDDKGTYARYMSQIVRRPLEVLVDLVVNSGDAKLIDNTVEARSLLERRFGVDLSRGGRGAKNLQHNIELSIRREDLNESVQRENRIYDVRKPLRSHQNSKINTLVDEARKKYKELYPNSEQPQADAPFKVERAYDDTKPIVRGTENEVLGIVERELPTLKLKSTLEDTHERLRRIEEDDARQARELANFDPMSLMGSAVKEKSVE